MAWAVLVVLIRSGARVPADGEIIDGSAELNESMITGESRPVAKAVGGRVVAGTVSTDSSVRVRIDAVGDDTALAGIQRLVAEAQTSKSRAQALADRAAALLFYLATAAASATDFRSITGRGVKATVDGQPYAVGGPALLRERGLTEPAEIAAEANGWRGRGAAVLMSVSTIVVALNAQTLRALDLRPAPAGTASPS